MKKLLLIAAGLVAASLYANQAQAAMVSWTWNFKDGSVPTIGTTVAGTYENGTNQTDLFKTGASGEYHLFASAFDDFDSPLYLVNDSTGLGADGGLFPTFVENVGDGYEYLTLDLTAFNAMTGGTASFEIMLSGINQNGLATLTWDTLFTTGLGLDSDANAVYIPLSNDGNVLYLKPEIDTSFQLQYLKMTFDDCILNNSCSTSTTPEPGVLGLLGFSLAGLAYLRRKN